MSKKTQWRNASTEEISAGIANYNSKLDRYVVSLEPMASKPVVEPVVEPVVPEPVVPEPVVPEPVVPEPVVPEPVVPEPVVPKPTLLYVYADSTGLGTAISVLSLLVHIGQKIELTTTHGSVYFDLIKIFNIPNITVVIGTLQDTHINMMSHDWAKIASPYFTNNNRALEQTDPVPGNSRPYIAVVANNGDNAYEIEYNLQEGAAGNEYPFNKYYSIDLYSKIYRLVHMSGYDIVTFNQGGPGMPLDKKVDLLKHCSAVIGYEGGIMHLAHVMQIPAIMLPWREASSQFWGKDYSYFNAADALHLDKRTYILSSADEITAWNRGKLNAIIQRCMFQHGNNKIYRCHQGDQLVDRVELKWHDDLLVIKELYDRTEMHVPLTNAELSLFQYLPRTLRLGGPQAI